MFKNIIGKFYSCVALVLVVVASSGIGINSTWTLYEPEIPNSLRK